MASEGHAEHLEVSDDASIRGQFLGLVADHQRAIAYMIESLSARETFGLSNYMHVLTAMRRAVGDFERTAARISEFCDQHIGE